MCELLEAHMKAVSLEAGTEARTAAEKVCTDIYGFLFLCRLSRAGV